MNSGLSFPSVKDWKLSLLSSPRPLPLCCRDKEAWGEWSGFPWSRCQHGYTNSWVKLSGERKPRYQIRMCQSRHRSCGLGGTLVTVLLFALFVVLLLCMLSVIVLSILPRLSSIKCFISYRRFSGLGLCENGPKATEKINYSYELLVTWRLLFAARAVFYRHMGFCTEMKGEYWQADTSSVFWIIIKLIFKAHFMLTCRTNWQTDGPVSLHADELWQWNVEWQTDQWQRVHSFRDSFTFVVAAIRCKLQILLNSILA